MMKSTLLIMAGGAIGAALRYHLGRYLSLLLGGVYPYGTFAANILGGLAMGIFMGYMVKSPSAHLAFSESLRLFFAVGLLGGFTTFSSFSYEILQMIERGHWSMALFYAMGSVILAVLACFIGYGLTAYWQNHGG